MRTINKLDRHQARTAYLFITPTMLLFTVFTVIPVVMALYLSFTNYDVVSRMDWVGLANYERLIHDSLLWLTFKNVTIYAVIFVPLNIFISLMIAMLLNRARLGVKMFRTLNYLPTLTSAVAAATVWLWLLHPEYGLVNGILSYFGVVGPAWLAQTKTAMMSIILVTLWQSVGANMVIYLAGLQGVPEYLYESAVLDGANRFHLFRYITWPHLKPTTFLVSTMAIIGSLQLFDQAFVLTQGGPANATKTPVYLIYQQGFNQLQMGYASAQAFVLAMFLPFYWSLLTSIKPDNEIFSLPIKWLPSKVTIEHYVSAFTEVPFGLYFFNSFFLATVGVLANLFMDSLSGYAFAKLRFKLNRPIFLVLLSAMMIPGVVTMIPTFYVLKHLPLLGGNNLLGEGGNGLLNSFWGVILPGASGSFAVFFMRQFFWTLPSDMMEMARIEGAGEFRIYWQIYLPLTKPALATLGIFTFQAGWNAFLWPMIILNDPSKHTIQMGLQAFSYNYHTDYGPMMAGALIAVLPILVMFVFLQRYFTQGIAFSGIKG